ncbi:hypothetical protein ACFXTI_029469 [Malus domestica]
MVLMTPDGSILKQVLKLGFQASNNEAEYEALFARLRAAEELQVKELPIHCNSTLIVNQVKTVYVAHNQTMGLYLAKAKALLEGFEKHKIQQVLENVNSHADALATIASIVDCLFRRTISFKYLATLSVHEPELDVITTISTR